MSHDYSTISGGVDNVVVMPDGTELPIKVGDGSLRRPDGLFEVLAPDGSVRASWRPSV